MTGKRKEMYICPYCEKECRGRIAYEIHLTYKHPDWNKTVKNEHETWSRTKYYKIV